MCVVVGGGGHTKGAKSVVDGDDDHLAQGCQDVTMEESPHADFIGAAMQVDQHCQCPAFPG